LFIDVFDTDLLIDEAFKNFGAAKIIVDRSTAVTGGWKIQIDWKNSRPTANGVIDETGPVHTGFMVFPDDRKYFFWYHPDQRIIYWDNDNGSHVWKSPVSRT
jgi:hypothetical protein